MSIDEERKGNVTMDTSSSYVKVDERMQRKILLAFAIFTVTLIVGFFILFILLLTARNPTVINNVSTDAKGEGEPVYYQNYTRGVKFTMEDGEEHYETISSHGNLMNIRDEGDGFVAIFDYSKNIFMVKNLTTNVCYFSRLSYIPEMRVDDMDNLRPFYCQEYPQGTNVSIPDPNMQMVTFVQASEIPYEYIELTNDISVAGECANGPGSYWLNKKEDARKRRVSVSISAVIFGVQIEVTINF